jgi:hypothetical protein
MSIAKTKEMIARTFIRSAVLLILSGFGLIATQFLIDAAGKHGFELAQTFPELMLVMNALFQLTWIEVSIMWIRLALAPNVDVQASACAAMKDPTSSAIVYLTHVLQWAFRIGLVLYLVKS